MASIPPFFTDAVVAIGYEQQNGQVVWGASGFFYFHTLRGDQGRVYLVTNKHVLEGNDKVLLRINPKAMGTPKGYVLNLVNQSTGQKLWHGHRIKKVDVAVIPVNFNLFKAEDMQVSYFHDVKHTLTTQEMERDGQSDGDSVYALGFPVSLVGDKSNSVIVRSGTIARIRDTFKSPTEPFLVDTTVFPGNSGGPVVNRPEFVAIAGTKTIDKASLIGIVASYVPYRDFAVSRQTQNLRVVFEENSGLSNVFSVNCIKTAIRSFERGLKKKVQLAEPKKSEKATKNPKDQEIQTNF
jgi:hypothetical protein